jgi:glyoxylase-like metal-dependent hydrolase (beta-lactamase superfamily II)
VNDVSERLAENLWRIDIPLVGNPLKNLNSYLIVGERNLLIDTGFNEPTCREAMLRQLSELGVDLACTDIFLTHVHHDHSGLSTFLHRPGCRIYISEIDGRRLSAIRDDELWKNRYRRCLYNGFSEAEIQALWGKNPAQTRGPEPFDDYTFVTDGEILRYGGIALQCLFTPGHTPGHMCLYEAEKRWLFTGDHVLFRITPNICDWLGVKDSLGDYLISLDKIRDLPAEKLFPGHRVPLGTLKERVDFLKEHHRKRLQGVLNIVKAHPGLTPYEIAGLMQWNIRARNWKEFPLTQKYFATGEAKAHLDYLTVRGKLTHQMRGERNEYFIVK